MPEVFAEERAGIQGIPGGLRSIPSPVSYLSIPPGGGGPAAGFTPRAMIRESKQEDQQRLKSPHLVLLRVTAVVQLWIANLF
jgi:hypothetical protein